MAYVQYDMAMLLVGLQFFCLFQMSNFRPATYRVVQLSTTESSVTGGGVLVEYITANPSVFSLLKCAFKAPRAGGRKPKTGVL